METICGTDVCPNCPKKDVCPGCRATGGHPFGGDCFAAEAIKRGKTLEGIKEEIRREVDATGIPGVPLGELYLLSGAYVNLAYPLPNGETVRLLRDENVYLGTQIAKPDGRCFGIVADEDFLLVAEYGINGSDPSLLLFRKRAKN